MGGPEFIKDFHNLTGITVGERRRNLQYLFKKYSGLKNSPSDLEFIVNDLKPTTHLERIFRVDVLINYQCFDQLFVDYKNGDEITINKLAKQQWFNQRAFHITNPDEFVDNFLPTVPFIVRVRILKNLQTDEEKFNQIFDKIQQRYGLFLATIIIHRCNKNKIRTILKDNSIKLTYRQLKVLFDKDQDLIDLYLEKQQQFTNDDSCFDKHPIFVYIAQKNPEYFCKLRDKYRFEIKLGNRTTKKFVISEKENILKKPKEFVEILRKDSLVKKLGDDFQKFFIDIFSRDLNNTEFLKYLQYYPKNKRFALYKTTFNQIFSEKFDDHTRFIKEDVLRLIRNNMEREKYARLRYEATDIDNYLMYYQTRTCFELIKDRLNASTIQQRIMYVELLTKCCVINDDLDSFLIIGEFIRTRFRNESPRLLSTFCTIIFDKIEFVDRFTEKHWEIFYDILNFTQRIYISDLCVIKMIEFYYNKTGKIDDIINKLGLDKCLIEGFSFKKFNRKPQFQKSLILGLLQLQLPPTTDDNKQQICLFYLNLIRFCRIYNANNPNDRFDIVEIVENYKILEYIKMILEDENLAIYRFDLITTYITFLNKKSDYSLEIKRLFFKLFQTTVNDPSRFYSILKYDPQSLVEYFDIYIKDFFWCFRIDILKTWTIINKYSHTGIVEKFIKYLLSFKGDNTKFCYFIRALSILMSPQDYLELAKNYKPEKAKVDLNDKNTRDLYLVQTRICSQLKNIKQYELILPLTLQFCFGDYLQSALKPLYSCFYHMPANQIQSHLKPIENVANISVKKHAIHLICNLLDTKTIEKNLKESPQLRDILKYFKKNPNDEIFELIQEKMLAIKETDHASMEILTKISIPLQYRDRYCKGLWEILTKFNKKSLKKKLLFKFRTKNIELCRQICDDFVKIAEIDGFLVDFIIKNRTPSTINLVVEILQTFKNKYWNKTNQNIRLRIRNFIKLLFSTYLESKTITDEDYFVDFHNRFQTNFQVYEFFVEFIIIKLLSLKKKPMDYIAQKILDFNHDLLNDYGDKILCLFVNVLQEYSSMLFETEDEKYDFFYNLFENRKNLQDTILIIQLLPRHLILTNASVEKYNKIMKALNECDDQSVKLFLNLYFCETQFF